MDHFTRASSKGRNSSLELLRIVSALMICGRHFVGASLDYVAAEPLSLQKVFLQAVVYAGGKVGVICFFLISAWYLSRPNLTVKDCFKRAWLLERDLAFWSATLFVGFLIFDKGALTPKLAVGILLPVISDVWWYPASYILFLILLPFVVRGLHGLGRKIHGYLSIGRILTVDATRAARRPPRLTLRTPRWAS